MPVCPHCHADVVEPAQTVLKQGFLHMGVAMFSCGSCDKVLGFAVKA